MKQYLKISNDGLIESDALTLMGASVKEDGKIGYFGTGNKYALARLLRDGYEIKMFSGLNEIKIGTKLKLFKDKNFNVITINNKDTSITTSTGRDWKLWFAIREFYSNAIDEGGEEFTLVNEITPSENKTSIFISCNPALLKIYDNIESYFIINSVPKYRTPVGNVHLKDSPDGIIFRKSIRVGEFPKTLYNYNFDSLPITEDRVYRSYYDVKCKIWEALFAIEDEEHWRYVLYNLNETHIENSIPSIAFLNIQGDKNESLQKILSNIKIAPISLRDYIKKLPDLVFISDNLFSVLKEEYNVNLPLELEVSSEDTFFTEVNILEIPAAYKDKITKALGFLSYFEYNIPYNIRVCNFKTSNVKGLALNNEIWISYDVLKLESIEKIAAILIEENIHLKYEIGDCTREMQSAILGEFVLTLNIIMTKNL